MNILTHCYRCPNCLSLPVMTIDQDGYTLRCNQLTHDHMAIGNNMDMSIRHWNKYVQFVVNKDINNTIKTYGSRLERAIFRGLHGISPNEGLC